jgi:sulfane dehydrogenase subunit SoxC
MTELSRRELLLGAAALGAASLRPPSQGSEPAATNLPGTPTSPIGTRSRFVTAARSPVGELTGTSYTPLDELTGTITPADLHFERHHAGVPLLDPARHTLTVHGLVERPTVFGLDELMRFPRVTRVHFVECSGNGRSAWRDPKPDLTVLRVAGMLSNSEWTGVRLADLFREAGARPEASWFLAEGADACLLARSIPMAKAYDDALVVWAQNGEPLRPEQGYPMRLLLPGYEGNANVKWLRRLELGTRPWLTRWETSKYTDPLPGGVARQFSFEMDAKSVITSPSTRRRPARGWNPISGIAWSGRGRITRVEVSTDAGATWHDAELQGPALPKAVVRFERMWEWTGGEPVLLSRATDETGYLQPTRAQLVAVRGRGTDYHFNPICGWRVAADGTVSYYWET